MLAAERLREQANDLRAVMEEHYGSPDQLLSISEVVELVLRMVADALEAEEREREAA
jgi:hypothetical protein